MLVKRRPRVVRKNFVANVSKRKAPNPLRVDPTRTRMLRKRFETEINRRYRKLRRDINDLVLGEDALGLAANYNPSQPRDAKGRWGSGGGGGGGGGETPSEVYEFGKRLTAEEASEVVAKIRAGDPRSKNVGIESREFIKEPMVYSEVSTHIFDSIPNEDYGNRTGFLRATTNPERVASYAGQKIDTPIILKHSKRTGNPVLSDGGHRLIAAIDRGDTTIRALVSVKIHEQLYGLTVHARWAFRSDTKKLKAFKVWLTMKFGKLLAEDEKDAYWDQYIEEGWKQGTGRAYADARPQLRWEAGEGDFYRGSKRQFMETAFATPVSRERVKLLAERAYTDLKGVTSDMGTRMARVLADGMIQGKSPRVVARDLDKELEIGRKRSLVIARTETVRAHNEGQLDAMELLGVEEVGVAVEWSTSGIGMTGRGNPSPCQLCSPLEGMVLSIKEARGTIPRHPNCMCSWIPANVGEDTEDQIRAKGKISKAIDRSIKAEAPKKRTLAEQRKRTRWGGADKVIRKKRPKELEPTE